MAQPRRSVPLADPEVRPQLRDKAAVLLAYGRFIDNGVVSAETTEWQALLEALDAGLPVVVAAHHVVIGEPNWPHDLGR